jgi:2-oxoglutarate ferredoxin oxidoreductase subunit beta
MSSAKVNRIGRPLEDYQGAPTTLCKGCGHNNITNHITNTYFEMGVNPYQVVKTSGIGCSSKTPAYFIHRGYGINAVHGRMPSVSLGAKLANSQLHVIGVSGDGDTASIGMGQFVHLIRRNLDMVYIIENNGVYGLTKGQFSATAEKGAKLKTGDVNTIGDIDMCSTAIILGGTFVARAYSNDSKQMRALLKASISHRGTAMLDIISPCVTFNNHEGSTKSIGYMKEHDIQLNELGFVPFWESPEAEVKPGEAIDIPLPDGSILKVRCLKDEHDPRDKAAALQILEEARLEGEVLTGLIYCAVEHEDFTSALKLDRESTLTTLGEAELRPPREQFAEYLDSYA